jgi:hypothetical protein
MLRFQGPTVYDGQQKVSNCWLVEWKDRSSDWIPLADLKNSYPLQVTEYAINNKIALAPAFAFWVVPHVLKKHDQIIQKVKTCFRKKTHKFGIEVPSSVREALDIDKRMGTDMWCKAIKKVMRNVMVAFDVRDDRKVPIGFKEISCHLVFDI